MFKMQRTISNNSTNFCPHRWMLRKVALAGSQSRAKDIADANLADQVKFQSEAEEPFSTLKAKLKIWLIQTTTMRETVSAIAKQSEVATMSAPSPFQRIKSLTTIRVFPPPARTSSTSHTQASVESTATTPASIRARWRAEDSPCSISAQMHRI